MFSSSLGWLKICHLSRFCGFLCCLFIIEWRSSSWHLKRWKWAWLHEVWLAEHGDTSHWLPWQHLFFENFAIWCTSGQFNQCTSHCRCTHAAGIESALHCFLFVVNQSMTNTAGPFSTDVLSGSFMWDHSMVEWNLTRDRSEMGTVDQKHTVRSSSILWVTGTIPSAKWTDVWCPLLETRREDVAAAWDTCACWKPWVQHKAGKMKTFFEWSCMALRPPSSQKRGSPEETHRLFSHSFCENKTRRTCTHQHVDMQQMGMDPTAKIWTPTRPHPWWSKPRLRFTHFSLSFWGKLLQPWILILQQKGAERGNGILPSHHFLSHSPTPAYLPGLTSTTHPSAGTNEPLVRRCIIQHLYVLRSDRCLLYDPR